MGWGTTFKTSIFISKRRFETICDVEAAVVEYEESIEHWEKRLMMLVAATPTMEIAELQHEVGDILECLAHDIKELQLLYLFKEHLKETGKEPKEFWS